ncbi:uncharacterized protein LOC127848655 [Dreissena polymorpha]|uniref:uncharacterized protein LOC127848655 n=1 Tax=Dreissena polymorpha TaxID=45954 RepID=UPI00226455CB|nr:uncharacterized protein LOC127848655 [Dreissena polymorpha]
MISRKTFDTIYNVCKIKNPNLPFGGIQIVLCGDFYQLPPVVNLKYNDTGEYCFHCNFFDDVFRHRIVLDQNMRTKSGEIFLTSTVQSVFEGNCSDEVNAFLNSLSRPLSSRRSALSTKLFATNALVDDYNRTAMMKHPGDLFEFFAKDQGHAKDLERIGAPKMLWMKNGCPVQLIHTLSEKLVNGVTGIVQALTAEKVVVEFPSVNITREIPKISFTVFNPKDNRVTAEREQFPLKPAFALTIHKSQGMTLENVEIDCCSIFQPGQLGVAISRVRSVEGLRVVNFHPRYLLKPTKEVTDIMNGAGFEPQEDLSCCRKTKTLSNIKCHI